MDLFSRFHRKVRVMTIIDVVIAIFYLLLFLLSVSMILITPLDYVVWIIALIFLICFVMKIFVIVRYFKRKRTYEKKWEESFDADIDTVPKRTYHEFEETDDDYEEEYEEF